MKLRRNQLVAIVCTMAGDDKLPIEFREMMPLILAGGPFAETNRLALNKNMTRIYGGEWTSRIVYRWRSKRHLMKSLANGERWRKGLNRS